MRRRKMQPDFLSSRIIRGDMENIYASLRLPERLKDSSFYITGASGMLASYFTYFLVWLNEHKDYGIRIFAGIRDKTKAEQKFGVYLGRNYFTVIQDDVNEEVPLTCRTDYVIHAASPASPQFYGKMPVETILPNVVGTYRLLEYSRSAGVKGFLFFSSGSVYGSFASPAKESDFGTMDFLAPGNCYGEAKRCGETLCRAYFTEYQVPAKSVRIFHTYGPTMDTAGDRRVFSEFAGNILRGEDIVLKSDGSAKRAFCYVSDAVSGMFTVLLDGTAGEAYNICNAHEWLSMRELAELLVSLYPEKGLKVICRARQDDGYKSSPERADYPADAARLAGLGWSPSVSAGEGFRRVIDSINEGKN